MDIYSSSDARLHPFVAQLFKDTHTTQQKATKEVLELAMAIDKAIDEEHGCGTSVTETSLVAPVTFEELWILAGAAFISVCRNNTNPGVFTEEAMHHGWVYTVIHGQEFQTPEELQERLELVALPFWLQSEWLCPEDEESAYTIAAEVYYNLKTKT